jgi:hypothetical protein
MRIRRPSILVFILLTLLTQPLFAQWITKEPGVCAPPVSEPADGNFTSTIVPLQPHERLLYGLTEELAEGTLELRYRVNGTLHLTESIDLAKREMPQRREGNAPGPVLLGGMEIAGQKEERPALPQRREAPAEQPQVLELLTLNPDSMRELHLLDRQGARIEVDVLLEGALRETVSFADLTRRSEQLRQEPLLPVFAPSVVSGAGAVAGSRRLRVATNEYLENCWECTEAHPCETECGYDPGKGGPVTCGEYGAPCTPTCPASYTSGEWWGPWTYYSTSYGFTQCFKTSNFTSSRFQEVITTYRRERIRRTTTCPNAPSCTGCYDTEAVIQVQYGQDVCWDNTFISCSNGATPCCYRCRTSGTWAVCGGAGCY